MITSCSFSRITAITYLLSRNSGSPPLMSQGPAQLARESGSVDASPEANFLTSSRLRL